MTFQQMLTGVIYKLKADEYELGEIEVLRTKFSPRLKDVMLGIERQVQVLEKIARDAYHDTDLYQQDFGFEIQKARDET